MSCRSSSSRLLLLSLLLLGGCAVAPSKLPVTDSVAEAPAKFNVNGRIGVRYGTEGFSGNLRWRHDGANDELLLLSPLGQAVARVERSTQAVTLDASDRHYVAQNVGELTERVLGWSLPLDGMQYWATGHAAPDGPASMTRDEAAGTVRLTQQQWDIEFRAFQPQGRYVLPTRITMRNGTLELKLVVDEWVLP
jgi:outer membrane lipoprotein LolB